MVEAMMQTGLHTRLGSHLKPQVPPAGCGKYVGKVCSSPMRFREIEELIVTIVDMLSPRLR
jgi:hypothetical protein